MEWLSLLVNFVHTRRRGLWLLTAGVVLELELLFRSHIASLGAPDTLPGAITSLVILAGVVFPLERGIRRPDAGRLEALVSMALMSLLVGAFLGRIVHVDARHVVVFALLSVSLGWVLVNSATRTK